jgi:hypothetical protein
MTMTKADIQELRRIEREASRARWQEIRKLSEQVFGKE